MGYSVSRLLYVENESLAYAWLRASPLIPHLHLHLLIFIRYAYAYSVL